LTISLDRPNYLVVIAVFVRRTFVSYLLRRISVDLHYRVDGVAAIVTTPIFSLTLTSPSRLSTAHLALSPPPPVHSGLLLCYLAPVRAVHR